MENSMRLRREEQKNNQKMDEKIEEKVSEALARRDKDEAEES